MLDKRTDGPSHPHIHHEGEGLGSSDTPSIGEPSEDLPF